MRPRTFYSSLENVKIQKCYSLYLVKSIVYSQSSKTRQGKFFDLNLRYFVAFYIWLQIAQFCIVKKGKTNTLRGQNAYRFTLCYWRLPENIKKNFLFGIFKVV